MIIDWAQWKMDVARRNAELQEIGIVVAREMIRRHRDGEMSTEELYGQIMRLADDAG